MGERSNRLVLLDSEHRHLKFDEVLTKAILHSFFDAVYINILE